jgi:hypothetical protein
MTPPHRGADVRRPSGHPRHLFDGQRTQPADIGRVELHSHMPGQPCSPQAAQVVVEVSVQRIEVAHLKEAGRFGSRAQPLRRAGSVRVPVSRDVRAM